MWHHIDPTFHKIQTYIINIEKGVYNQLTLGVIEQYNY